MLAQIYKSRNSTYRVKYLSSNNATLLNKSLKYSFDSLNFNDCDLNSAILHNQYMPNCSFVNSNLSNCDITSANLKGCTFRNTNMLNINYGGL